MYAGRKRRKPVQRTVKHSPAEGVKSNPSKRHRDRLNSELDRLASLLPFPEEVTSSLDKLSILRLSVSYLRAKNFFNIALKNHSCTGVAGKASSPDNSNATGLIDGWLPEGELLLQALGGFVLVVTSEGHIFYSSHTIQDYLGFHQTDVMHQSVFELIHTEDQQEFRRNLHWALNPSSRSEPEESTQGGKVPSSSVVIYNPDQLPPENSSFLERSFVCRFRCLLDNSSGFLALNLQGRLKFLHGQNRWSDEGSVVPPQLALFVIAMPLQPPSILEIRTKNMIFRTKHKLDFTPLACDAKGKIVLGYTEAELRVRGTGYQFIHAADMLYCAENHVRMIKTGESGLTVFRLLTKENRWKWVQANARLVYKNGKPDYIIATQRPLVEEEGGEHLRKRSMHLPFTFATGEALLYQTSYPIPGLPDPFQVKEKSAKSNKHSQNKQEKVQNDTVNPSSLLGAMMRQDESVYVSHPALEPKYSFNASLFSEQGDSASFPNPGGDSWNAVPNGSNGLKPELATFGPVDPLLSTLDSLSLDNDEDCSNNELFSALEMLGLNAEDLELLLLDERMIRIEIDPGYIPSLNDLLTNNEILSYVHDSLENRTEEGGSDNQLSCPLPVAPQTTPKLQETPAQYYPHQQQLPQNQQPILQLSQQMQQHLHTQNPPIKEHQWTNELQSLTPELQIEMNMQNLPHRLPQANSVQHWDQRLLGQHAAQNSRWITQHVQMSIKGQTPEHISHTHQGGLQPLQHKPQLPQQQLHVQLQSQCNFKQKTNDVLTVNGMYGQGSMNQQTLGNHNWQGYSYVPVTHPNQVEQPTNMSGYNTVQGAASSQQLCPPQVPSTGVAHYNMSDSPNLDFTINGGLVEEVHQYQGVVATASSYQMISQKQQVPSTCFSQYPPQNPSLEQFLGVGQQQHQLSTMGMFTLSDPQDNIHDKMENGCILTNANLGYPGGCLLPNVNGVPQDSAHPNLPDTQTTGFYL
ncbi:aryl hydrocarbon receptor-like [Acipenser ruthenus]|nr:aryl hydrocarbon receptor-like [Acipenser ruthenus]